MVAAVVTLVAAKPTSDNADSTESRQAAEDLAQNARDILKRIDTLLAEWNNKQTIAGWDYASNLTDENLAKKLEVSTAAARIMKQVAQEVNAFAWQDLKDENMRRQFMKLGVLGTAALPEDVRMHLHKSFS